MGTGDLLDVILVLVALAFALSGYRQGFIVGILSFAGFIAGGVLGAKFSPDLHSAIGPSFNAALFGLITVFVFASVGQLAATAAGAAVRQQIRWRPVRLADHAGGAMISTVSVLLVAWLVGTALAHSNLSSVSKQVRHSAILGAIDDVMPDSARTWFSGFRRMLDTSGFPQVFGALGPERIVNVPPPDPAIANSQAVRVARPDIVKIIGVARSCSRQLEGSGFVYAPERVMTNAHVVAGVSDPQVSTVSGRTYDSRVVLYDPHTDVAVLYVPGLDNSPLHFTGPASTGQSAVVAGYPENGPFTAVAARIRTRQSARGPDIYQSSQVTREIYSIYARVLPGNSGGPLLAPDGGVYGVVFAAAVDDSNTGYALTAGQVAGDARAGQHATAQVGTGACD